jgi:hypothetical protein
MGDYFETDFVYIRRPVMLKKLLVLALMLSLLTQSVIVWGENYNFRYTRWGMTQKEVIDSEKKLDPVEKTENLIKYKTQILGKNVELLYLFSHNKLIGSSYKLEDNYLNSQHFISTYKKFREALTRKYGQPNEDTMSWLNDTYKIDRKKWGLALSLGHTKYVSLWDTQKTNIKSSLREANNYVLCSIEYRSADFSYLFSETNKEDEFDPF